jgi:CRP-like cAMP-binding protein
MILKQSELFEGLSMEFIRQVMDIAVRETRREGELLFRNGDVPDRFYILIQGQVQLTLEPDGAGVYSVDHPGELIGWSALVQRDSFSTAGKCSVKSDLLRLDTQRFFELLANDADTAAHMYKNLSKALGHRLMQLYEAGSQGL